MRLKFQHTAARRRLPIQILGLPPLISFQHTAARRRLLQSKRALPYPFMFQHTAARRRLQFVQRFCGMLSKFQHTAARRRLQPLVWGNITSSIVSTHSRPKAAAIRERTMEGRLAVSTHSRPKAAACLRALFFKTICCFNTQPPEGGCNINGEHFIAQCVSTHSRPKAAAFEGGGFSSLVSVSTHSRPKAAAKKESCNV